MVKSIMTENVQYSTAASWVSAIYDALVKASVDGDEALKHSGIPLDIKKRPDQRVDALKAKKLWSYAVAKTDNDAFGLDVIPFLMDSDLNALGVAIRASASIKEAMERVLRYYRAVSTALTISVKMGETLDLEIQPTPTGVMVSQQAIDAAMGLIVHQARVLMAEPFVPIRLEFMRPEPKKLNRFESFFGCPLYFECDRNAIVFSTDVLKIQFLNPNEKLAQHIDQYLLETLAEIDDHSFSRRVYSVLFSLLPSGTPTLQALAAKLHMSTRTLQRRLQDENINFKELLNRLRYDMARHYLKEKRYSVGEIGYLLGFSSHSNFVRFFRQQSGQSPSEYLQSSKMDERKLA